MNILEYCTLNNVDYIIINKEHFTGSDFQYTGMAEPFDSQIRRKSPPFYLAGDFGEIDLEPVYKDGRYTIVRCGNA